MATIWVAVAASALCVVFAVVLAMGAVVVARHRAGGAADLAALAAADHALEGERVACGLAERVARGQGAHVVKCAVRGEIADLVAEVPVARAASVLPSGASKALTPRVRARAGPATVGLSAPVGSVRHAGAERGPATLGAAGPASGGTSTPHPAPAAVVSGIALTWSAPRRPVGATAAQRGPERGLALGPPIPATTRTRRTGAGTGPVVR
ncbi:flp pilus-assembly TadE/G-like family protein [Streptomyces sp. AC536]|uniref:Rv3654c family TadE-like protein n=1 Tax=Streptomyces buecherae TaxID=2763006 RepID=UPI00164E3106|nr:flp pilus-assembly TadE/G-like family protein [Streptomyces buecherae]QNJ41461.1 flp pilus-assembly TadE/G-like family protein [Streptomyces buecherae]